MMKSIEDDEIDSMAFPETTNGHRPTMVSFFLSLFQKQNRICMSFSLPRGDVQPLKFSKSDLAIIQVSSTKLQDVL